MEDENGLCAIKLRVQVKQLIANPLRNLSPTFTCRPSLIVSQLTTNYYNLVSFFRGYYHLISIHNLYMHITIRTNLAGTKQKYTPFVSF